jgi:hypothetical protein
MGVQCFLLEPTNRSKRFLRRYGREETRTDGHYHSAIALLDEIEVSDDPNAVEPWYDPEPFRESHRDLWPKACKCGYQFTDEDHWQIFRDRIYRRTDTGQFLSLREAPPGSMWYADWMGRSWSGPDGHSLMVVCPNGSHWLIDGPANNCTKPDDHEHRCWIRHGTPPMVTVDKNGNTCAAGAGSIQAGDYHGFLRNGVFDP